MGKSVLLMGPPGSGKTTMIGLTAVHKPVHFIDIDRKVKSLAHFTEPIAKGEITVWEVGDPLVEDSLAQRARTLARNEKMIRDPKGWLTISELVDKLATDPVSKGAGTWAFDSMTMASAHLLRLITKQSGNSAGNMRPPDWNALLMMWQETVTILIDHAKSQDKDIIFTVHERISEIPTESTKVVRVKSGDMMQREYLGALDLGIVASIQGQFGIEVGKYFEEFYGLRTDLDDDRKPVWVCRVHPDGKRNLRTSFPVKQSEFKPDFREIWKS